MTADEPVLTEQGDRYVTKWHCDPPPQDTGFIVVRQEWTNDFSERHIYEWKLAER